MRVIFDIGMYDGADTAYYLALGFRVVAVEANPNLVEQATVRFADAIAREQLTIVGAAVAPEAGVADLMFTARDLGASTVVAGWHDENEGTHAIQVPAITLADLIARHGVPYYLKVDIEGADHACVTALTVTTRPPYLSFEVGNDVGALVDHAVSIGYRQFKLINQLSFRAVGREYLLRDRLAHRAMRSLGYLEPRQIRRAGRFFVSGHSSGPAPWQSDGPWVDRDTVLAQVRASRGTGAWYDVQAQ